MAKGTVLIGVCSVGIVFMFSIMVYLMSTVNPPEEFGNSEKKVTPKSPLSSDPSDESARRSGGMYFDEAGVLPIVDTVQYGLEKIDTDMIDFYGSTKKEALKYQNKDRKVIPPLWPRATQEIIVNPTMHKVMPPIWPTTSVIIDTIVASSFKPEQQNNSVKVEMTSALATPSVKPMKRRSVSNYILDQDASSVLLRILDYNGQSKIEIKIWSDVALQRRKDIGKGITDLQNKSKYTLTSENDEEHKTADSAKNTVVTICANDSVVIEETGGTTNVTELLQAISIISTTDENEGNVTDPMNTPDNEEKSTVISSKNITNPMGDIINSSIFEMTSNRNISNTTHEIVSRNMNKTNDFDIFSDIKTNNTEFNKRIFNEETNIVMADTTRGNAADDDKISIRDIYPTNFTDLFIEGESDMVY